MVDKKCNFRGLVKARGFGMSPRMKRNLLMLKMRHKIGGEVIITSLNNKSCAEHPFGVAPFFCGKVVLMKAKRLFLCVVCLSLPAVIPSFFYLVILCPSGCLIAGVDICQELIMVFGGARKSK